MKPVIADRLNNLNDYVFAKLAVEMKQVEAKTHQRVLNLGAGSPDISPSPHYLTVLQQLVTAPDAFRYPGYKAVHEFSGALVRWYKKRFSVEITENEVLPLLGAKDGVVHLPWVVTNPHDEVLVPDPGYPAYTESIRLCGAVPIPYNTLLDVQSRITSRTKAVWMNYPSNPTGEVVNKAQLKSVVALCREKNVVIFYDNAYSEITYGDYQAPSILEIEGAKDIAIEIGSFSKTFSFAGFRMGWAVGNSKIIQGVTTLKSQLDSGMSLPLQRLGAFALDNQDQKWQQQMLDAYQDRLQMLAKKFQDLGCITAPPQGGLYLWAKVPSGISDVQFAHNLLHDKLALVTPGSAFGNNGQDFVRISACTDLSAINEYI